MSRHSRTRKRANGLNMGDPGSRLVRLAVELRQLGVSASQTERLLSTHPPDLVEQQLAWLPARKARRKASLIIAAIDRNYEEPLSLRDARADS